MVQISFKISVIIPVYSRFSHLKHAVENMLAQTLPVSEVISIDEGSIDETRTMVSKLISEDPRRHKCVSYFH